MRLDKRRDRSDLIETFKILNGNYKVDKDLFFVPDDDGRRGHSKSYVKDVGVDWIFKNLLLAIELLVTLSENCVSCTTLNNFKSNIGPFALGLKTGQ